MNNFLFGLYRLISWEIIKERKVAEVVNEYLIQNFPELWRRNYFIIIRNTLLFFFTTSIVTLILNIDSLIAGRQYINFPPQYILFIALLINGVAYILIFYYAKKRNFAIQQLYFFNLKEESLLLRLNLLFAFLFTLNALFIFTIPYAFFDKKPDNQKFIYNYCLALTGEYLFYKKSYGELSDNQIYPIILDSLILALNHKYYPIPSFEGVMTMIDISLEEGETQFLNRYKLFLNPSLEQVVEQDSSINIISLKTSSEIVASKLNNIATSNRNVNIGAFLVIWIIYLISIGIFYVVNYIEGKGSYFDTKLLYEFRHLGIKSLYNNFLQLLYIIINSFGVYSFLFAISSHSAFFVENNGQQESYIFDLAVSIFFTFLGTWFQYMLILATLLLILLTITLPFIFKYFFSILLIVKYRRLGELYNPSVIKT